MTARRDRLESAPPRAGAGVAEAADRWTDPRARLLRRRRAAGAATAGLGGTAGLSAAGTASLAAVGASEWLVVPGVGVTAVLVVPTVAVALRLRRLRATPLPPERTRPRPLPGPGSPLRAPLQRLGTAEASLGELLGVLGRDPSVPPAEVDEARDAARLAAGRLRTEAGDLEALVRARDSSPVAARELRGVVDGALARVDAGVGAFEQLVAAAARAVAARSTPGPDGDLVAAVDRVDALTAALGEIAAIPAPRA
ncbi:hypothetical protein GCM10027047_38010 [Rhodococcus aerolatus]